MEQDEVHLYLQWWLSRVKSFPASKQLLLWEELIIHSLLGIPTGLFESVVDVILLAPKSIQKELLLGDWGDYRGSLLWFIIRNEHPKTEEFLSLLGMMSQEEQAFLLGSRKQSPNNSDKNIFNLILSKRMNDKLVHHLLDLALAFKQSEQVNLIYCPPGGQGLNVLMKTLYSYDDSIVDKVLGIVKNAPQNIQYQILSDEQNNYVHGCFRACKENVLHLAYKKRKRFVVPLLDIIQKFPQKSQQEKILISIMNSSHNSGIQLHQKLSCYDLLKNLDNWRAEKKEYTVMYVDQDSYFDGPPQDFLDRKTLNDVSSLLLYPVPLFNP